MTAYVYRYLPIFRCEFYRVAQEVAYRLKDAFPIDLTGGMAFSSPKSIRTVLSLPQQEASFR